MRRVAVVLSLFAFLFSFSHIVPAAAIEGPVTAMNPASALQLHRDARFFLDEAAAAGLRLRAYYDECAARESAVAGARGF